MEDIGAIVLERSQTTSEGKHGLDLAVSHYRPRNELQRPVDLHGSCRFLVCLQRPWFDLLLYAVGTPFQAQRLSTAPK